MPLPMVHLAVAVKMQGLENCLSSPDFLLGSIAPDAIHMRPKAELEDKLRVHLAEVVELRYERARKLLAQNHSDDHGTLGFTAGYVAHLLTDYLWRAEVIEPFQQHLPQQLSSVERRALYYQETDQVDFDLYRQMSWQTDVWSALSIAQPQDFAPLLTSDEIKKWCDRVLTWFDEAEHEPKVEPSYITYANTQRFIDHAALEIICLFTEWKSSMEQE